MEYTQKILLILLQMNSLFLLNDDASSKDEFQKGFLVHIWTDYHHEFIFIECELEIYISVLQLRVLQKGCLYC